MKLATIRTHAGTSAVRVDDDAAIELGATDLGEILACPGWKTSAALTGRGTIWPG